MLLPFIIALRRLSTSIPARSALTGASTVFLTVMVTVKVADLVIVLKAVAVVNSLFAISLVTAFSTLLSMR